MNFFLGSMKFEKIPQPVIEESQSDDLFVHRNSLE